MTKIDINTQDDLTNLFNMSEAELEQITHFSIVRYRNMNRFLQIAEIFPRCPNLITLKINYGCMDIHELEQIIGILPQCRKLTNLDFRNNYDCGDKMVTMFTEKILHCPTMISLDINSFARHRKIAILDAIEDNKSKIYTSLKKLTKWYHDRTFMDLEELETIAFLGRCDVSIINDILTKHSELIPFFTQLLTIVIQHSRDDICMDQNLANIISKQYLDTCSYPAMLESYIKNLKNICVHQEEFRFLETVQPIGIWPDTVVTLDDCNV